MDSIQALILARFACVQAAKFASELQKETQPEAARLERLLALQRGARQAFGSALKYLPMHELKAACSVACLSVGGIAKAFPRRDGSPNI